MQGSAATSAPEAGAQRQGCTGPAPTLLSLPRDLLERVLGLDKLKNCISAAQINHSMQRVALDALVPRAANPWALRMAVDAGSATLVKALLDAGGDPNLKDLDGRHTLAQTAALRGQAAVLRVLVQAGADVSAAGGQPPPMYVAVQNGQVDVIRVLLTQNGVGIDDEIFASSGLSALHFAANCGQLEVAACLLDHGADLNLASKNSGAPPLSLAAAEGHAHVVALLLERGAEVDRHGLPSNRTPLMMAVERKQHAVVQLLLSANAAPDYSPPGRMRPLYQAVAANDVESAELLLAHGADVNAAQQAGIFLLHHAARLDYTAMLRLLLAWGSDKEVRPDNEPITPLMLAALYGRINAVKALLKAGCDVNATAGLAALRKAAEASFIPRVVHSLQAAHASGACRSKDGFMALELADACGHESVAALLRQHAA